LFPALKTELLAGLGDFIKEALAGQLSSQTDALRAAVQQTDSTCSKNSTIRKQNAETW
jgi:hypothetical protein